MILYGMGPNQYLKGIDAIHYSTVFFRSLAGLCAIQVQDWATSLKFVADQSAGLKFIQEEEWENRLRELSDSVSKYDPTDEAWLAAVKKNMNTPTSRTCG